MQGAEGPRFGDLDYLEYVLWVITSYDPREHPLKFDNLLGQYRKQLKEEDPRVRYLSPKYRTSLTLEPLSAYTTPSR